MNRGIRKAMSWKGVKLDSIKDMKIKGKTLYDLPKGLVGVYALHMDGIIVYVGQGHCIFRRIRDHVGEKTKSFNGYSFICINKPLEKLNYHTGRLYLNWLEVFEINHARPKLNRQFPSIEKYEFEMPQKLVRFCRLGVEKDLNFSDEDYLSLSQ